MVYLHLVLLSLCILSAFASDPDPTPKPPLSRGVVGYVSPSNYIDHGQTYASPKPHPAILLGSPDEKGETEILGIAHSHPKLKPTSEQYLHDANDYVDKSTQLPFKDGSLVNLIPALAKEKDIKLKKHRDPKNIEPKQMERLQKDSDAAIQAEVQRAAAKASTSKISPEDKQGESKRLRLESTSSGNFKSRPNSAKAPSGSLRKSPIPRVKEGRNPSRHNSKSPQRGRSPKASTTKSRGRSGSPGSSSRKGEKTRRSDFVRAHIFPKVHGPQTPRIPRLRDLKNG